MAGKALDYLVNGQDLSWATKVKVTVLQLNPFRRLAKHLISTYTLQYPDIFVPADCRLE